MSPRPASSSSSTSMMTMGTTTLFILFQSPLVFGAIVGIGRRHHLHPRVNLARVALATLGGVGYASGLAKYDGNQFRQFRSRFPPEQFPRHHGYFDAEVGHRPRCLLHHRPQPPRSYHWWREPPSGPRSVNLMVMSLSSRPSIFSEVLHLDLDGLGTDAIVVHAQI